MSTIYDYQGNEIVVSGDGGAIDYDKIVKGVAHRGYSAYPDGAPENTIPAFKRAKEAGFGYVETDVQFSSDDVPVCIHDATVDRTSNGTGSVSGKTLTELKALDFGSWGDWSGSEYAGTKIPTFEEFLAFCRAAMLHPYIELKNGYGDTAETRIQGLVDMVVAAGLKGKVTWISFNSTYLGYIKEYDPAARLGFLSNIIYSNNTSAIADAINTTTALRTGSNEVFLDMQNAPSYIATACKAVTIPLPLERWTEDTASNIRTMDKYITGVTSNKLIAGKVLYDNAMG